jgi:DNA helicase-2/ATP-dependent DNA helicase PcrA
VSREWSIYQVDVFNYIKTMVDAPGALMVEAVAGSGKTTTIVESLKLIPVNQQVLFLAFNKHIAEELKRRVPPNVQASTLNSFGWGVVRNSFRGIKLDDWKTRNAMRDFVVDPDERRRWDGPMKRLIGLKKATLVRIDGKLTSLEATEIANRYDLDLPTDPRFMIAAADVWKKVTSQTSIADFDDQIFLPVLKNLPTPKYDWVFVDEAQDLSSTQIELIKGVAPRIVAVGDPAQAIYAFRGANPEAMSQMREALSAKVLPLSICYRCPLTVVAKADAVLMQWDQDNGLPGKPYILPSPTAEEGVVDDVDLAQLRTECTAAVNGEVELARSEKRCVNNRAFPWVLCRTTAPLVKECLKLIVEGVKATVKGRDIGQQLIGLIEKVGGHDIVEFTERLVEWHQQESKRLEQAGRDAQLQALDDRVESIHALAEGARTTDDVIAKIENVFKDEASIGVTFATAHRSKGLEADDIYILCPDLMPFPKAKSAWARKQERNLKYVAFTRAMKRLRMVVGPKRKPVEGER